MKHNNTLIFLALFMGILIGGGLNHLLLGTGRAQAEGVTGLSNEPETMRPETQNPEPSETALRSANENVMREKPEKAPVTQVSSSEAAALLNDMEPTAVAVEDGTGTVFGRVIDTAGQPMSGAVIRLTGRPKTISSRSPSKVGQGAPDQDSLKETVRKAAQDFHDRRARNVETSTDEQGQFRFEGLLDLGWSAKAYLEDFVLTAESSASSIRIGAELNFTAALVQEVPVEVVMTDGNLAERAFLVVTALSDQNQSRTYRWSSDGAFLRLIPGRYKVRALSHGSDDLDLSELASSTEKLSIEAGVVPEALVLNLVPRLGISGYIRAANDGSDQNHCMLRLLPLAQDQEVDLALLGDSDQQSWARPGRLFTFTDLEAGRYLIGAARDWGSPIVVHEVLELSDASAEVLLQLPERDLSQILKVVALDATGAPLDDVDFSVRQQSGSSSSSRGVQSTRDKDATYLITIPPQFTDGYFGKDKSGATYSISATHPEMGTTESELTPGQTDLVMTFVVPGKLTVTVPGYVGSGYEGRVHLHASRVEGSEQDQFHAIGSGGKVTPTGIQVFEGLEPGTYLVSMTVSSKGNEHNHWGNSGTVNSIEVNIREGENSAQLAIPNLYPLRVHWADGKVGKSLHLSQADGERQFGGFSGGTLDENLIASWDELPAGEYRIEYYGGQNSGIMEVTVPCGEIEFVPMEITAMRVSITSLDGNLAKVGLRDGDLVIGADGKEFESQAGLMAMGPKLMNPGSSIDLMVQRGNKVVTITVKGADMGDWSEMGGQMNPTSR
ncbi:MAG: hypothetical protein GY930_13605 [bacterium]|nr:hypothetical protein [bacterium]